MDRIFAAQHRVDTQSTTLSQHERAEVFFDDWGHASVQAYVFGEASFGASPREHFSNTGEKFSLPPSRLGAHKWYF